MLKIKANVDFQNREDVRGDSVNLARNYARLWGRVDTTFTEMGTITLAHLTDLQSHAIASDSAFARFLGPIHERRVVSVAVGPSTTAAFGAEYAVDWNCMRVCAESKFAMTISTEGHSLMEVALRQPVSHYVPQN